MQDNQAISTAKEIVGKWGYEEKEWWEPIANAITQAQADRDSEWVEAIEEMRNLGLDYYEDIPSEEEKYGFNFALDHLKAKMGKGE